MAYIYIQKELSLISKNAQSANEAIRELMCRIFTDEEISLCTVSGVRCKGIKKPSLPANKKELSSVILYTYIIYIYIIYIEKYSGISCWLVWS